MDRSNRKHLGKETVLTVALLHGYEHLVLGAWGCGVFRNDPREIAELFADALLQGGRFHKRFATVTFAVLDQTDESIVLFLAQGLVKQGADGGDESENITVHEVAFDGVLAWLNDRKTSVDLKLLAAMYAAQFHLKVRKN